MIFAKLAHLLKDDPGEKVQQLIRDLNKLCYSIPDSDDESDYDSPNPVKDSPRITVPNADLRDFRKLLRDADLAADTRLIKAWKELRKYFSAPMHNTPEWRVKYAQYLLKNVIIVRLVVPASLDLQAVFETLNARGKQLDDVDLLKNFFLHRISEGNGELLKKAREDFEIMDEVISRRNRVTEYVRCDMQTRYGFLAEKRLYHSIRSKIISTYGKKGNHKEISDIVSELGSDNMNLYKLFKNPGNHKNEIDGLIKPEAGRSKRSLFACLQDLSKYSVSFPVLYSLHLVFLEGDGENTDKFFIAACRSLSSYLVREQMVQHAMRPSFYEREFASLAMKIRNGSCQEFEKFNQTLIELDSKGNTPRVIPDKPFVQHLSNIAIKSRPKVRKLLLELENQAVQPHNNLPSDVAVCSILPSSPESWPKWPGFEDLQESYIYRLGNYVLLEASEAEKLKNTSTSFQKSQKIFRRSAFTTTKELGEIENWDMEHLSNRQKRLAKKTAQIWCF